MPLTKLIGLCCGLAMLAGAQAPATKRPPNIVFIFSDDHGAQAISAYGSNRIQTPNLDRLAASGMLFERCLVTNSICAPSRATVLTGTYSHRNGVLDNGLPFDGSQATFPKLLQRAGYQTAMIGKWHLKSTPTGFDHYDVLPGQGHYFNPDLISPVGRRRVEGHCTDIVTDLSLEWLEKGRDKDRPFLLMCQHKAPHRNWMPALRHLEAFADRDLPEPPSLFDDGAGRASPARQQEMTISRHMTNAYDLMLFPPQDGEAGKNWWGGVWNRMTPAQQAAYRKAYGPRNAAFEVARLEGEDLVRWKYQRYAKNYLRCILGVDESVGRVLDALERHGLAENTIVVYSSDQGWFLGEHGWYDKRWIYEESLRTPLIVRWPGVTPKGSRHLKIVSNLDFAPTLLEAAGVPAPSEMQGRSLVPLLRGQSPKDWRKSFYYHYYEYPGVHAVRRHCGVITERHKLVHYYQEGLWELFDLAEDPDELVSVAEDPRYAKLRGELTVELRRLQEEVGEVEYDLPLGESRARFLQQRARRVPARLIWAQDAQGVPQGASGSRGAAGEIWGAALTFGGVVVAEDEQEGVLLAKGGARQGVALVLRKRGIAEALLRRNGKLHRVSGIVPEGRPASVVGRLTARGELQLLIDGQVVDRTRAGLVAWPTREGVDLRKESGSRVVPGDPLPRYTGAMERFRLYRAELSDSEILAWTSAG